MSNTKLRPHHVLCHSKLRPHHVLCISFFEGKGYNPEFVQNMTEVIENLHDNTQIQLTVGADIICDKCPNNKEYLCQMEDKVRRYDETVLSLCHLFENQVIGWKELKELAFTRILNANKLKAVCGDCCWNSICQEKLTINGDVSVIGANAFYGCTELQTISWISGSFAETYAKKNGYIFITE
ncbi:MAG TPA: DUF1284 domain-containing protein [Mobilitalea sp.]|nr:DUF1284 domain-containing protein [Mobilitalea sp.]